MLLVIEGPATGKGRHRVGAGGRMFTPKETVLAENQIRSAWQDAGCPAFERGVPVKLEVVLSVARPKSHYRKDGSFSAEGLRHLTPDNKKPDVDNALKLVMDALNKRAWADDVQIVEALVRRIWNTSERTLINAREAS